MKEKKTIKSTMDSRVYKMAIRQNLYCPICGPNKGCNRNRNNDNKSWKTYRDTQWKD